jgi:hypothetical protein
VAADDASGVAVLAELAGAGWSVVEPAGPAAGRACTRYPVRSRQDAQAVVVAAVRGEPVFAQLCPGSGAAADLAGIADDLVEDLGGLGPVVFVDAASVVHLDEDSWRLAHEIARGATLEAAARSLHLSTRTANRRLTAARQALGVDSRAQLVRALTSAGRVPAAATSR